MIINRGNLDLIPTFSEGEGHQHTAQMIKQSLFVWMSNEAEVEEQNVWICTKAPLPLFRRGRRQGEAWDQTDSIYLYFILNEY